MIYKTLAGQDKDYCIWVQPGGKEVWVSNILLDVGILRNRHENLQGKRVILRCNSPVATARGIVTLDGFCREMLLVHPDTTENQTLIFSNDFCPDAILTDKDFEVLDNTQPSTVKLKDSIDISTRWIIPTSGTTGTPKLISHEFESLSRTVKSATQPQLLRWGLMYGITRFAGLQVLLQSIMGGGLLLFPPSGPTFDDVLTFLAENDCTAISATPTFWRKILMAPVSEKLHLRQITLGGEIVDQAILDSVNSKFPGARVVHIYASTETGVGFTVKDGRCGFPYSWLDTGVDGVQFKILDECLWLRLPGRVKANHGSYTIEFDEDGYINTGDRVCVKGDRIFFLGRSNGTINVGGNKTSPEEIEQVILSHPDVLMASVYGINNLFSGQIVVADVVLTSSARGRQGMDKEIRLYCRERLERYKVPARISFVDTVSMNESGKAIRRY